MNSKAEPQDSRFDTVKLITALLILVGAVGGFYYYSEQSTLVRVLGLLAAVGVAALVALQTDRGRFVWAFFKDAQVEVRKVVWPTRKETVQTTLIVMAMVIVVAIFLWLLDMLLAWAVRLLTGQGG